MKDTIFLGKQLIKFFINKQRRLFSPVSLGIMLTYNCNLKCQYCIFHEKNERDIDVSIIKNYLTFLQKRSLIRVGISGGEPFLKPELLKTILNHCKKLGLKTSINTNGTLIDNYKDIINLTDEVVLSLDGPMNIHDSLRGAGSFQKTINAINIIKNYSVKINTLTVVNSQNYQHLDLIKDIALKYNIKSFFQPVFFLDNKNNYSANNFRKLVLTTDQLSFVSEKLLKFKYQFPKIIGNTSHFLKSFATENSNHFHQCLAGSFFSFLSPEGDIISCCAKIDDDKDNLNISMLNNFSEIPYFKEVTCTKPCFITPFREMDHLGKFNKESVINTLKHMFLF